MLQNFREIFNGSNNKVIANNKFSYMYRAHI